jgi:agmatine/peptidylarginine deiminase
MKKISLLLLSIVLISSGAIAQQKNENSTNNLQFNISKDKINKLQQRVDSRKAKTAQQSTIKRIQGESVIIPDSIAKVMREQIRTDLQNKSKRNPNISITPNIKVKTDDKSIEKSSQNQFQKKMEALPSNRRMVGEFEEVQAVVVSIPSLMVFVMNNQLYPCLFDYDFNDLMDYYGYYYGYQRNVDVVIPPGCAAYWPWYYELSDDFNEVYLIPQEQVIWLPELGIYNNQDGTADTRVAKIWGQLIYEIQQSGAQAWIRLTGIEDSADVKEYFANMGYPMTNYKFFSSGLEDAFWARDWGPFGIYYDDNSSPQKLGFVDANYYTGRAFDDEFPKTIFNEQGYDYYELDVKMEGGNIMNDGWKYGTYGDVIYGANTGDNGSYGQYFWDDVDSVWKVNKRTPINKSQLDNRMKQTFNFEENIMVQSLKYDGGTGHIDLWAKQFDEESILIANMPDKYSGLMDYKLIQQNREVFNSLKSAFGTNYRLLNAPIPRLNNSDMPNNDSLWDLDPRSYLNGVTVNNTYIYPGISASPNDANWAYDSTCKEVLKKLLPGYRLVPIDARYITPMGGAIHCITMQIPQDPSKLVTIRHKPIRDYIPYSPTFDVEVELTSNTLDANRVMLWWKKSSSEILNGFRLNSTDGKTFTGTIGSHPELESFDETDTVKYFVVALKDNEQLKFAPITGKNNMTGGYYEFYFDNTSVDEIYGLEPKSNSIASVYPNPATDYVNVIFETTTDGNITLEIVNPMGQVLQTPFENKYFSKGVFTTDIFNMNLQSGVYFLRLTTNNGTSISSFIMK